MNTGEGLISRCLARLHERPFVEEVELREDDMQGAERGDVDGVVRIVTPKVTREFGIEVKRTHLTRGIVDGVLARTKQHGTRPWISFAPKQVLFALLTRPTLVNAPIRRIAEAARVAPATAADRLNGLKKEGLTHEIRQERAIADWRRLLDQWVRGYETLVRPRLMIGRYETQDADPNALERRIDEPMDTNPTWAYGGGAGAFRLTGYYRGEETVVHLAERAINMPKQLRALSTAGGAERWILTSRLQLDSSSTR